MVYPETFTAFQALGPDTWSDLVKQEYKPRPFGDFDVDIKIQACGVCGSDVHTLSGGWGDQKYPLCCGHEIVGKAIRIGSKVTLVKVGQRVGVGAQSWSCLECRQCKNDNETYCPHQRDTYGAVWPDGTVSQGGFSSHVRTHEHWVFPIPDALPTNQVAPMLCAGLTVYSPLVRNGAGPGKKVAILGMGGLGHFGVMFAKALGAEVWVIALDREKDDDAKKLGATGVIATNEEGWLKPHFMTFNLIINSASSGLNPKGYLDLLDVHGRWINLSMPAGDGLNVNTKDLFRTGCLVGSSHLGSRKEVLAMLKLAAEKGIKGWVEEVPISAKGLKLALERLKVSDVKYRFTMTNYEECFGA